MSAPQSGPPSVNSGHVTSAPNRSMNPAKEQLSSDENSRPAQSPQHHPRSSAPPLDTMRAYRACLNCRNRKSKCDLDINGGRPPCRRCQREARDCVLGESHRGGRRVRKKPKVEATSINTPPTQANSTFSSSVTSANYSPLPNHQNIPQSQPFHGRYDNHHEPGYQWQHPTPSTTTASDANSVSRHMDQPNMASPPNKSSYLHLNDSRAIHPAKPPQRTAVQENIASVDLQNPSDALEILARVADRAEDGDSGNDGQAKLLRPAPQRHESNISNRDDYLHYKPVTDGIMSPEMVYHLFSNYEEFFHPFFPIIPRETFNRQRIPWLSQAEPHLFSAILTIASKDNEQIHQVCYDHMQHLISMILAGSDADVEAVEALLLLSQWVSHRPQASLSVGRGEEDRVAWMCIGTALRLGYFLGIDRTSFRSDSQEDPAKFNRKRLVWAACYVCDRQVSVRLGKGFWARGPGPLSGLKSTDFPSLQPVSQGGDNWALIFQANLELTQIFSNVHDILYSSKGHGWKEMLEGRYAKYLDDFRTSIRNWNEAWGTLICSPRLKASLLLTYDYLRLYVNAFAYQATISRALTFRRDSQYALNRPVPLINAAAPDARFIYEAIDAAKSLLSTSNNFVDPETLRYMPSSYYLFIIYSAVFLYKARSTTTMTDEERTGLRRMINQTIDLLQKASVGSNHMGSRYARLLQLLWRKAPKRNDPRDTPRQSIDGQFKHIQHDGNLPTGFEQHGFDHMGMPTVGITPTGTTFSWLDLGATWNFATQNNSVSGSSGEMDDVLVDPSMNLADMSLLTDYSLLEGDNPHLIF